MSINKCDFVFEGSESDAGDPVAGCAAWCDAAPAELAAVMGERAETGYLPLPAGPAAGDAARCGAVPQPAEPAAETGGVAGIGYLPLPARPVVGNAARRDAAINPIF